MKHRKKETMSDKPLKVFKGNAMRDPEKLAEELDRIHRIAARTWARCGTAFLKTLENEGTPRRKSISELEADIRATWKIREIIYFNDFTHGGTYDAGKGWRINYAGYVADTAERQRDIIRLFDGLKNEAYFFIGMKMYAEKPATPPPVLLARFDANEESPLDMTLNELIRSIPSKAKK